MIIRSKLPMHPIRRQKLIEFACGVGTVVLWVGMGALTFIEMTGGF